MGRNVIAKHTRKLSGVGGGCNASHRVSPARAAANTKIFVRTKKRRKKKGVGTKGPRHYRKSQTRKLSGAGGGCNASHGIRQYEQPPVRRFSREPRSDAKKKRIRTKEPRHYRKSRTRKLSAVGRGTQRIARNTPARAAARTKIFVRTKKRRDKKEGRKQGPRHYRKLHTRKLSGA